MDLVNRCCTASRPNQLWVDDFTDVATWKGFAYVIDVFSRMIVGWQVAGFHERGCLSRWSGTGSLGPTGFRWFVGSAWWKGRFL